uniref:CCDC81 HU domain-containing protein n=1 Tax=Strigamia maritima TaxID=126957 RepID=T1J392_STRMM
MRTLKLFGGTDVDLNLLTDYPVMKLEIKSIVKEDIAHFWNAVCTVIDEHLRQNKGVILSGIGNFTYISKQHQTAKDRVNCTKEPIFIISDKLATANWLRRPPVYYDDLVPSQHLNFFLLSNYLDINNCKLRRCYTKILENVGHFIMIRKPFILPFPGIGKLNESSLPEDYEEVEVMSYPYPTESFSSFPIKHPEKKKKKDVVGRSMTVAKRIKETAYQRSVDKNSFSEKNHRITPTKRVKQCPDKSHSEHFIIAYPKPSVAKCDESNYPIKHNPSAFFLHEFSPPKFKKKCIHHEDFDTCPSRARPQQTDKTSDRLNLNSDIMYPRLKAGEDDSPRFVEPICRCCQKKANKKLIDAEKKETFFSRYFYDNYARKIRERKELLRQRRLDAREHEFVNKDVKRSRERNVERRHYEKALARERLIKERENKAAKRMMEQKKREPQDVRKLRYVDKRRPGGFFLRGPCQGGICQGRMCTRGTCEGGMCTREKQENRKFVQCLRPFQSEYS